MRGTTKYILIYLGAVCVLVLMAMGLAQAQENNSVITVEAVEGEAISDEKTIVDEVAQDEQPTIELNQAELDQMLAPIALYPDTLLSQILVASTYPLEIIQAARWRDLNSELDEDDALEAVENKDWDPSVKALVPFTELLNKLSEDLDWLQQLGDAFLTNEEQVLASVQSLRLKARDAGSLTDSEYIEVVEEEDNIIIQPVEREVIYVPYYDTRTVYGSWWWNDYQPVYWHRPAHYYWHAGIYWSPRFYVRPSYFLGGFHWHRRHLVVNHHYYNRYGRYDDGHRRVRVTEYQRWNHDPVHRRGARYNNQGVKSIYHHNKMRPVKVVSNTERYAKNKVRQVNAYGREVSSVSTTKQQAISAARTENKLKHKKTGFDNKANIKRAEKNRQRHQSGQQTVKHYAQNKSRPVDKSARQLTNNSRQKTVNKQSHKQSRDSYNKPRERYNGQRNTRKMQPQNRSKSVNRSTQKSYSKSRSSNGEQRSSKSNSSLNKKR